MTIPSLRRHGFRIDRLVVPILIAFPLLTYFIYTSWIEPIDPHYANYDPEFQYLLNSLAIFQGRSYLYTDHPGTPLEVIGTGIYGVTYPLLSLSTSEFISYHIGHPGLFLTLAHGFLLAASIAAGSILALTVASGGTLEHRLLGLALALGYFVLHPMAFASLKLWSHNSFAFAFGTPVLVAVLQLTAQRGSPHSSQIARWGVVGAAAGLLAAVTIYMAAWMVAVVMAFAVFSRLRGFDWARTLGGALVIILAAGGGFLLGVIPALARMPVFFDWIESLVTHRSPYLLDGGDQSGIVRLAANLVGLARQMPVLAISVVALLTLLALSLLRGGRRMHERPGAWAVALASAIQILMLTALILDHPKAEYMLSVAAVVPILACGLLNIHEADFRAIRILRPLITAFLLVGGLAALVVATGRHHQKASMIQRIDAQTRLAIEKYVASQAISRPAPTVVWTYGAYAPCLSLWFGNDSTGNSFRREIGKLCPRDYEFDPWSERIVPGRGSGDLADLDWDMVIGCADAFRSTALQGIPHIRAFPDLQLSCGSLTIGQRAY